MKTFDFLAVVYKGEVYCRECLPKGVSIVEILPFKRIINNDEKVMPIFADSEGNTPPVCSRCGKEHDYVIVGIEM